jgi:N-acetylglucosaminyldiphosphoundecaprenol N-acetyl-beta-D-mannosaminyltransferase
MADSASLDLPKILFLDAPVTACPHERAVEWLLDAAAQRTPAYAVTLNAQYLWQMSRDDAFRRYVLAAGMVAPEYAIVWGARQLGLHGLHHLGGILLLRDFLERAPARGLRVYLLGARPEVVGAFAAQLAQRHGPGFVAGWHDGFLTPEVEQAVADEIERLRPDAVFVGMGLPRQDQWIERYGARLGIPLCMGVGGSFDVLAGFKPDTPAWARGRGLEWLYRIYLDPRAYLQRYLTVNTWFVSQVLRRKLARSSAGGTP